MQIGSTGSAARQNGTAVIGGVHRRATVLRILTDLLVMDGGKRNSEEAASQEELMMTLVAEAGIVIQQEIAQRLATLKSPPPRLVNLLARLDFSVAAPMLRHSNVLSDAEYAEIALTTSLDHARTIAALPSPGPATADAIFALEDPGSILLILRNESVRPSIEASRHLLRLAADNGEVANAVIACQTFPADLLANLYWLVAPEQREQIVARLRVETKTESWPRAGAPLSAPLTRADDKTRAAAIQGFSAILRAGRTDAFKELFSRASGVAPALTDRIVADESGAPFAIACRAVGIPAENFLEMLILYNPVVGRSVHRVFALNKAYEQISTDLAMRLVECWNRGGVAARSRTAEPAAAPLRGPVHDAYAVRTERSAATYASTPAQRPAEQGSQRRTFGRRAS